MKKVLSILLAALLLAVMLPLTALAEDHLDGLSLEYKKFRLNLRASNTEPLLRLNIETRADKALVDTVSQSVSNVVAETCAKQKA